MAEKMTRNTKDIIQIENLKKHYGKVRAVDGVSLCVRKGEIYGFLGLNGAGKTTTIRMLLGMVRPTSGSCYLNGKKIHSGVQDLWNNVGYLVEIPYSYPDLTVHENLEIIKRMRFISNPRAVDSIVETFRLGPYQDVLAKNLSHGNKQRLGLAKAMIHNPDILILDEPANGLDPAGIVEIRELLRDLAFNKGVTIFISSHILGEISKLATRIGIIHQGHLVKEITAHQVDNFLQKKLIIGARDNKAVQKRLSDEGYAANLNDKGDLEIKDKEAINHPENIVRMLVYSNLPLTLVKVEEENLETYFLRIIKKDGYVK
ncbi:MAG: ABC transporter ATP-binding protein [Candidatus Hodarchaeota archaeon]